MDHGLGLERQTLRMMETDTETQILYYYFSSQIFASLGIIFTNGFCGEGGGFDNIDLIVLNKSNIIYISRNS